MPRLPRWPPQPQDVARLVAVVAVVAPLLVVLGPWIADTSKYGAQDWDFETSQRYLTKLSLLSFHQAPFWNPYACGGFPAWGFIEGGTNLASPWLPAYLALPMTLAIRVEALGYTLVGAVGAWAVTGRYTRSYAARALVVALWGFDSRWALQSTAGHTWHLLYAWMPWCLYFFERMRETPSRARHTALLAVCLALLVYGGGIYPLPHIVVALLLYAGMLAVADRSPKPIVRLLGAGVLGAALSAPKLLPMLHELPRFPRLIASNEVDSFQTLWLALTERTPVSRVKPAFHLEYRWLEYSMYVSVAGVIVLGLAAILVWGRRETPLKIIGLLFVVLGLGSFHAAAPWRFFHDHVPFFASEHVPTRFWYPALLLLSLVAASGVGSVALRRPWLDPIAAVLVLALGLDVAFVSRAAMTGSMALTSQAIVPGETFHHEERSAFHYKPGEWATPMYLPMVANRGVIECYGTPELGHVGALSVTDARFKGEAFVAAVDPPVDGAIGAMARVAEWSPNRVVLALEDAVAGSTVVYNMNYDDGWTADEGPVLDFGGRIGVALTGPTKSVTLTYRPRLLLPGLLMALGALAAIALLFRRERRLLA